MDRLPISSKYVSSPAVPVDDRERESVLARLNAAYTAGSFDADAYGELMDRVFAAKTLGELRPVVEALPPEPTFNVPANIESSALAPGELSEARSPMPRQLGITIAVGVAAFTVLLIAIVSLLL